MPEIKVLRDDSENSNEIPTKSNIINAMSWLVKGARREDSLVFHCMSLFSRLCFFCFPSVTLPDSGHGGQIRDQNGDEADGYDEGLSFTNFHLS